MVSSPLERGGGEGSWGEGGGDKILIVDKKITLMRLQGTALVCFGILFSRFCRFDVTALYVTIYKMYIKMWNISKL